MKNYISPLYLVIGLYFVLSCSSPVNDFKLLEDKIILSPDYTDITIPPNIAPLNFKIMQDAKEYLIEFSGESGSNITLRQSSPKVNIPEKKWHKLIIPLESTIELILNLCQ